MSHGVAPPVVGLELDECVISNKESNSTLEDIRTMSRREWVCSFWAGGIVNIPSCCTYQYQNEGICLSF